MMFSKDPTEAEQQMNAVIFYLTTFGYVDGDFDAKEKEFVRQTIGKLVRDRADAAMKGASPQARDEIAQKFTKHFHEVFEGVDTRIRELFSEPVSKDEDPKKFVLSRLKLRCFEIFKGFPRENQDQLMSVVDELIMADGEAHPAELEFRGELAALLEEDLGIELDEDGEAAPPVRVDGPAELPKAKIVHPFFAPSELHYSRDPEVIKEQIGADLTLIEKTLASLDALREKGQGTLAGKKTVADISPGPLVLDSHTYVMMPAPGARFELTVLGDLHGCYSVLKATILQTKFFDRVEAYRRSPKTEPYPLLVLLGDYIDRGLFSLNGVLRAVMSLFVAAPEHVVVLRGNHEYYVEFKGQVYGGVKPAESINTLKPHVSLDVFRKYAQLFETMPNVFLFDKLFFVHGGIPRDRSIKEKWTDLSSLNDPDLRFQMMWSDPSTADVVPAALQDASARFAFGRHQLRSFMQRVGTHTVVRGHEKTNAGFEQVIKEKDAQLFTLFSAGGPDNEDLPADSSYRTVTPMALTIRLGPDGTTFTPFAPDYKTFNAPEFNAFFRQQPEIEHRAD
ncbi:MAG: serine/threonine protein phosphatase [Myxococcales bacterium]|nr:serine/threonine protein phosphatase [Myxococcales bacterium]